MKKMKIFFLVSLILCLAVGVVKADYPFTIVDDLGNAVEISAQPERIVSLAPSHTEILFALGAGSQVVGRTDFCDYPAEAATVTSVGGYSQPSVETIMAVQPDLVLASFGNPTELLDQLRDLGVKVVGYDPQTFEEIIDVLWDLGRITGQEEGATLLIDQMQVKINEIKSLVGNADRPLVFWEVWHDPLYTAGPNTYIDDLITIAGGINLADDAKNPWPVYSLEVLMVKNPEVYIATKDQWAGPGDIPGRPGYDQLRAVQNDRVYVINANNVNRPGPRLIEGLEEVARVIHPELFE